MTTPEPRRSMPRSSFAVLLALTIFAAGMLVVPMA